jgi:hypothetical protein
MSQKGESILAALIALLGWGGLVVLVDRASPLLPYMRMVFLALLLLALTTTSFLPLRYLYRRFARPTPNHAFRHSFWVALFVVLCAWLQMRRDLDWAVALLMATVFGLIEGYLLSHE